MKFTVKTYDLLKQLQNLSGVLGSNNSLPILECILFEINGNKLKLSASDLETTMTASMVIHSKDEGNVAIPAKILIETLKTFPDQLLSFTIDKDKFSILISSDSGEYKFTGHNGDDFPKPTGVESPSSFEVEASSLSSLISKTLFAVGTDELRPAMTGVNVQMGKNGIIFAATDAHKLVRYTKSDITSSTEASYILPKKPLTLLKNTLSIGEKEENDDEEKEDKKAKKDKKAKSINTVIVDYNKTNVAFTYNNIYLVSLLIDAKYPDYDKVIPKDSPNKLLVDRAALLNSIKRVSVFSNKTTHQIRLALKEGKEVSILAEDLDFSNEANETLDCDYKGTDLEIGFNAKFLADILSGLDCDEITIDLNKPNNAGIIKPYKSNEDILMLIMPVMLNK